MRSFLSGFFPLFLAESEPVSAGHRRSWLPLFCGVLALTVCGAWNNAAAQTVQFAEAQSVVANAAANGLNLPNGVAVDFSGNVYISDTENDRVLKETPSGGGYTQSVVVAFNNSDTGLQFPNELAVDGAGNLYIPLFGGSAVLKETPSATGYTQSNIGGGLYGPEGVAVDGSGNVYISDELNGRVLKETLSASGYTQSVVADGAGSGLALPQGIAVDGSGNVYITDPDNNRVLKETPSAGSYTQSVVANAAINGLNYPGGVAVDASGNVYIADSDNKRILMETLSGGSYVQSVIANAANNGLSDSWGIAVDGSGNVYIGDSDNNQVLKVSTQGGNFGTVNVGSASAVPISMIFTFETAGTLGSTAVVTQGATNLDFTDAGTGTCDTNGSSHTYNVGDSCTVVVAFKPTLPGTRYGAAELLDGSGNVLATGYVQGTGVGPQVNFLPGTEVTVATSLAWAAGMAVDASGNIYITDYHQPEDSYQLIYKETFSGGGYTLSTIPTNTENEPGEIAVDGAGDLYIVYGHDALAPNSMILKETPTPAGYIQSTAVTFPSGDGIAPFGIAVDGSGNIFISSVTGTVYKETLTAGSYTQSTVATGLPSAVGIAVDSIGNVYVAVNVTNGWIVKLTPSTGGYTQSTIPVGNCGVPFGVAVDGIGNVYVACTGANDIGNVFKETPTANGYSQSVVQTSALNQPMGIAVDGAGNVYVGNSGYYSILKEDLADPPSLKFATTAYGATSTDSPRVVTVENNGNAALNFSEISYPSSFPESSEGTTDCSQESPLSADGSCTLTIDFSPLTLGTISGSLVLTDNNLNAAAPGYASQTIALSGTGIQATPVITWATPAAITYGTALSATQLDATASVPGTFSYSLAPGTILGAGPQTLSATFTPTDTTDYTTATATVTLMVNQATPAITWATPAAITYGTALGGTQLNATASVAGSFSYSPAAGTVLGTGPQTLKATFTPTDTTDYNTATATVTLTVNQATPTITWATPATITYGTALGGTQLNATASVAGSFSYSPAAGTVLGAGSQTLKTTFTPTDATDYTTATASASLTVNQATPGLLLAASANSIFSLNPVTFTATLSPVSGAALPTGTVTFFDGSTQLAAVPLTSGSAAYTTSALTAATHAITAVYSGDSNYLTLTSSALNVVAENFTIAAGGSTLATVSPGGQAVYSLLVSPPSGDTFPAAINLAVTGLPAGATATFAPTSIPAGAGSTTVTLTVSVPATAAMQLPRKPFGSGASPFALGLVFLPIALFRRKNSRRLAKSAWIVLLLFGAAVLMGVGGCGGSGGSSGTPPQSYTLTVTATSGALSNSTALTLTVE